MFTVVIVDDSEDDRLLTQLALEEAKLAVTIVQAVDGEDGLAKIRAHKPDLVLLDINMPRMDGMELLATMRANGMARSIPVVIMSTSQADADVLRSYTVGASAYVTKPLDFNKFQEIVTAVGKFFFTVVALPDRGRGEESAT